MMNASLQHLRDQITGEKRKLGILVVLLVLALLLWGRLLIPSGPQQATGQHPNTVQEDPSPDGEAEQSQPLPEPPSPEVVRVSLRERVERDPFRIRRDMYEPTEASQADQPEKPAPDAEQRERMHQQRRTVRAEAERLNLQSTLIAREPQAIINGRPLTPGQTIRGFQLIEVRSRQARLIKQGVEVTLRIQSD